MEEKIENRLNQIHWSTYLYNTSISELKIISDEFYSSDEINIVNNHTFDFYRVTLQYCFIMEYCKLLEKGNRKNEHNVASLNRLNEIFMEDSSMNFQEQYNQNFILINTIKNSDFYKKIKDLRNKKFAHTDNHKINKQFNFEGFRTKDFDNAFEHLRIIKTIFNNFGSVYGVEYDLEIPSRDDRTRNFIKFHAEYQLYYMQNFLSSRTDPSKK